MSSEFNVFTSIRSDGSDRHQLYLLSLHRDRLVEACKAFDRDSNALEGDAGLAKLEQQLRAELIKFTRSNNEDSPVKLRLELTRQEAFHVTSSHVPSVPLSALYPTTLDHIPTLTSATYRIFVSPLRSTPSLFTKHKTTNRPHYDEQRALLPARPASGREADMLLEMLLVNNSGQIMEGTITTPYFLRNGEWLTPSEDCGGHLGVTRRWALMKSLAKEHIILAEDVDIGEIVILSNGVRGFGWGRVEAL